MQLMLILVSCYESDNGDNLPESSGVGSPNASSGKDTSTGAASTDSDAGLLALLDTIVTVLLEAILEFSTLDMVVSPSIPFQEGHCRSSHQMEHIEDHQMLTSHAITSEIFEGRPWVSLTMCSSSIQSSSVSMTSHLCQCLDCRGQYEREDVYCRHGQDNKTMLCCPVCLLNKHA